MTPSRRTDADPPEVTLLTCVPHGRFEIGPQSADGRGGIILHQAQADRLVSHLTGCPLRVYLSLAVRPWAGEGGLAAVRLTCRTGARVVAVREFDRPRGFTFVHRYRGWHEPLTIYDCVAELELGLRYAGLVSVEVAVKLSADDDFLPAAGRGWCHFTDEELGDTAPMAAWRYALGRPFLFASLGRPNRLYRLTRRVRGLLGRGARR